MSPLEIVLLNRARTTFQRVADGKFFNGWVKHVTPDLIIVHTCTSCELNPGDEFAFQVYGNNKDAFFSARLKAFQGAELGPFATPDRSGPTVPLNLGCEITSAMVFKDCVTQPRFCVQGLSVDLKANDELIATKATVIDVGPSGFAALSEVPLKKGEIVEATLHAFEHKVCCRAEVRNCVKNALNPTFHRLGMLIMDMERVDGLRWKQLYSTILEQNKRQATSRTENTQSRIRTSDAA
jgi:hypothetical protein